jgi:predicted transposase YbfD/YdcC
MDTLTGASAAIFETTVFLQYFKDMPDHRQPGKVAYRLDEVLLLALLSILAGAEGFTDMARFGQKKLDLLRRFLPFAHGTPSHDHLGDIFASLDPQAFREGFVAWVGALTQAPLDVIAIDGKTSRRSGRKGGKDTIHMVSAFAARQRLVLAQTKVNEKSNEIVAIPALLDMLSIEGALVTIDAMGCQRNIAQKIIDKKADYVLALKGNQGTLREDVELFAKEQKSGGFADATISVDQTVDADHGRIETRRVTVVHDVAWLQERHKWPGLKGVVIVDSHRQIGPESQHETRYYVTSSNLRADRLGAVVRDHWAVENSLHWVMDMTFRDDECRIRTEHAPENVVTLKHMAANLARRKKGRDSVRLTLKTAAWDDEFLAKLVAA